MSDDIKLPELPRWQVPFIDCDPSLTDIRVLASWAHRCAKEYARAAVELNRAVPDGLLDRIKAAERRISDNHSLRRIPADPTDVDLVLAEVRLFLTGKPAPFWIATPAPEHGEG